jgi:UDP-glucose 6-dehydrogenase
MRLGIFGTGYAGLVTAAGLAEVDHTVTAIEAGVREAQLPLALLGGTGPC